MSPVAAYFRERFPVLLFGPVCLLLTMAAAWSASSVPLPHLAVAFLFGTVLVVQFRLWDDLEDHASDRVTHPTRVLVNAPEGPFRMLWLSLMLASAALGAQQRAALAATLVLNGACWCAYRLARPRISANGWRFGVLPLKYPGFVAVIALSLGDVIALRLAAAAATSYVCASGYELLHDAPAVGPAKAGRHDGGAS